MDDKKYEEDPKVNFRGIKFQFPIRVHGVLKTPTSGFSRNYMWLQTASIGCKNISAKWFFDFGNHWKKPNEISDELKQTLTYGVAFELHEDSCKMDQEIVAEIQNLYPGNYKYVENHGNESYIWERDCLTIFVKRAYQYPAVYSIPEVSFCYSLETMSRKKFTQPTLGTLIITRIDFRITMLPNKKSRCDCS
ncbi:hypothetical protein [Dyadobacter chenhuakuii]|uniref:Uncharacterized protein n=1 Tax=Dyadobacter chenhuakuii TaxID=2909339 RepID=A0ABY4XHC8_9BACT|nr:hypothetical protein [Dyadobacter chenhuakuii]MCF2495606.1 hypothetical protein [Dyadobacter chenhuakuii]USJ29640.1 hypothetical protein NFI80_17355 [Dyadobacter chenhuakuii]